MAAPTTFPVPGDDEAAFRYVLVHVARSIDSVYRTAEQLCCVNPAVAAHVRELADDFAADALDALRRWPG